MIDKKAAIEAYKIAERNAHDMVGDPAGYLALTGQCPVAVVERQAQRLGELLQQLDEVEMKLAAERQRADEEFILIGYAEDGKGYVYEPRHQDRISNPIAIYRRKES